MKVMKLALLGTAALAAASLSVRADDLTDLKAQIEALNSRIATLEAAPSVPAGYSLMTMSASPAIAVPGIEDNADFLDTANTISILPTADVPASASIQWSGFARAALVHSKVEADERILTAAGVLVPTALRSGSAKDTDIFARGEVKVVATTETAVGEVGVQVNLRGNFHGLGNAAVSMPTAWGWWKMTPELTFAAGYNGTLANIGYGYDGACNCYYTDNAPVGLNPGDTTQMRLSYASGPLSFAIALEDHDRVYTNGDAVAALDDSLGVAGELKYSGDMFNAEVSGGYWSEGRDTTGTATFVTLPLGGTFTTSLPTFFSPASTTSAWQLGAGLGFTFDPVRVSMAAGAGQDHLGADYWKASVLASVSLSDQISAEIAYGYANAERYVTRGTGAVAGSFNGIADAKTHAVLAGLYYNPVSQLTIGLEGEWFRTNVDGNPGDEILAAGQNNFYDADLTSWQVDLVTVFRF